MLTLQNITKAQWLLQIFFTRMEESYEENRYITQPPGETMPLLFCSGRRLWNASYRFCVSACSPLLPRALSAAFGKLLFNTINKIKVNLVVYNF